MAAMGDVSFFVREVGTRMVSEPRWEELLYLAGRTSKGDRFMMYVEGFVPHAYILVDGWDEADVEEVTNRVMEVDKRAEVLETYRLPTWFNENKECRLLEIRSRSMNKMKKEFAGPVSLTGKSVMVTLHQAGFRADSQLLYRSGLKLMSWVKPRNFRPSGSGTYTVKYQGTSTFDTVDRIDMDLRPVMVRLRCVSAANQGRNPYAASFAKPQDYIASAAAIRINQDGTRDCMSATVGEDTSKKQVVERLLEFVRESDTILSMDDNYPVFHWMLSRAKQFGIAGISTVGRDEMRENNRGGLPYLTYYGRSCVNVSPQMAKEFVSPKLEGAKLAHFVHHDFYWDNPEKAGIPARPMVDYSALQASMMVVTPEGRDALRKQTIREAMCMARMLKHTIQLEKLAANCNLTDVSLEVAARMSTQPRSMGLYMRKVHSMNGFLDEEHFTRYIPIMVDGGMCSFEDVEDRTEAALADMDRYHRKNYDQRKKQAAKKRYKGGIVYTPKPGFYRMPVFCLDFSALYPSIMIAEQLAHATILCTDKYKSLADIEANKNITVKYVCMNEDLPPDDQECAVIVTSVNGERPISFFDVMVQELLDYRKSIKRKMKHEEDPVMRGLYDAQQLAAKVNVNAAYGLLGTEPQNGGKYPVMELAGCTTAYGRYMNRLCETLLRKKYGFKVVYGDTDSVIGYFPKPDIPAEPAATYDERLNKAYWDIATAGCDECTKLFEAPNELEPEANYQPLLLVRDFNKDMETETKRTNGKRKVYVTVVQEKAGGEKHLKIQGFGSKRRNYCKWASDTVDECIDYMFPLDGAELDVGMISLILHRSLGKLVRGEVPMEDLIVSCELRAEYALPKCFQMGLKHKYKSRDGRVIADGERVSFVFVKGNSAYTRVEPIEHLAHYGAKVDYYRYIDKQLRNLFLTLVQEPMFDDVRSDFFRTIKTYLARSDGERVDLPDPEKTAERIRKLAMRRSQEKPEEEPQPCRDPVNL